MRFLNRLFGDKKRKNLEEIVDYFIKTSNASDARRILEQHPELLSVEVDSILFSLSQDGQTEEINNLIQNRRQFLALCRDVGIAQAFDQISRPSNKISSENLQKILNDILSLSGTQEIPRKIMMIHQALSMVQQQSDPEFWASLHIELGNNLYYNPQGNRSTNIEQAIFHYNQALKVYTYSDFPVKWADLQNNLGAAHLRYTRGDRAENLEKAIEYINRALEIYTYQYFPVKWADLQNNLAMVYHARTRGYKAENIEKAIQHYNSALKVRTQKDSPEDWAYTHSNLGNCYKDRILGDQSDNFKKSIEHYNQALKVFTRQDLQVKWADTQRKLALTYWSYLKGNRAENIEKAIEHYNLSLEVRTKIDFPEDWAINQNELGNAYWNRIRGDKANNIERAIEHYNQALEVRTQEDFPEDWAMTQNNLANAYCDRIRGDKAENIEKAIEHYNQALKVRTQKDFPVDWAETQSNLAGAYLKRVKGNRATNIELAINHYNQTLEVRTQEYLPEYWGITQNNLATAYLIRMWGDKAENIERGIEHCNLALEVRTQEDFPEYWAMTQFNLAGAYSMRILGDKTENIEQGIEHYNKALKVRTQHDFPIDWAETMKNLAFSYENRIKGDKAENNDKAISYYNSALQIYKLESAPYEFRSTCKHLGDLYFDMNRWEDAVKSYRNAIIAGDFVYKSGISAESKSIEVEKNRNVYKNACFSLCNLNLVSDALLILEEGKIRLLSESLKLKMKKPQNVPKKEWENYEQVTEKYRTAIKPSSYKKDYASREKEVLEALGELNAAVRIIQEYDPDFQKKLDISDILSILDEETALLTFCITDKGSIGFVVSESNGVQSVDLPGFKNVDLNKLFFRYDEQGLMTGGWVGSYMSSYNALDTYNLYINLYENKKTSFLKEQVFKTYKECENTFEEWKNTLNDVLYSIGSRLLSPLIDYIPSHIKKLIILPSSGLFLLPLHAISLADNQLLCQRFCISYSPSIPLIKEMRNKAGKFEGKGIYEVINPQEDPTLVFSGCEGQAISKFFKSPQVDVGEVGTLPTVLDRIPGKAYLHFSCHGSYNWNYPSHSGLHLFGGRPSDILSLEDLQSDKVDMSSARLVTLSACETGITDILKGSADEFVGLPAGFMLAGVPCIVSSLWSVPEISTAMLMERFYSNHIDGRMDIPQALQDAQLWVRDLTSRQVADYVEKCYRSGKWKGKGKEFIEQYREHYLEMVEKSPDKKPFQHPYYWAAFTVNGA